MNAVQVKKACIALLKHDKATIAAREESKTLLDGLEDVKALSLIIGLKRTPEAGRNKPRRM